MRRSLIERLSSERDDEPRHAQDYRSINDLRDAVTRDLEELLNTRSEGFRVLPLAFPECRESSLTYGIPDFSSQGLLGPQDRDRVRRALEKAIHLHEKRLTRVRIALEPPREHERALRFRVDAVLDLGADHEKVRFDAVLQLATQVCAVS
ncbi:type VI secretion system baseplate subunit TssE [Luteimonas sp. BDR2-5]|uniref:type VI secretion system baseplate subunit TssE n=1 Tax=Proluteimonas luteida TaxID=2878685 RepID=UPI001E425AC3|nr:type VI secretion system baseplate subunit TssE [Luteimonas sp. BDR2-5]MCD9029077.1 type VI secretion system baseplate subunit TssE [Luteimonas sp. BDR2-5]